MGKDFLTVEELNFYINNLFLEEELLHSVPVLGEVSGCSVVGGHCYFTLKDSKAQIKVCFFNYKNGYVPQNGEQVLVKGKVDYFIKGGQLSLNAFQIVPYGKGEMHIKLEELKIKLEEEGLFSEKYKKAIPPRPSKIAIITSIKGAAFQDFFTTVRKKNQLLDITVIDVRVQGESCVEDICTALNNADYCGYDIVILSRGGGSFEDLYAFNDESMVRTIFNMKTPIISAIGHETDYTLCDFVSDKRAITPTAAAEIVGFDTSLVKNEVLEIVENISKKVADKYNNKVNIINNNAKIIKNKANLLYNMQLSKLLNVAKLIRANTHHLTVRKEEKLSSYLDKLESLSPLKQLDKGYFKITKDE
ncbi:MAG TPA: exodeoxyribonuclease VII large subunit, partial [Clostridia bacterium]|nr:exodeoxyribonuclease VII large subunit [Clostridia bacterium]